MILHSFLILLRLIITLTTTSTIHPDEYFQNPEIASNLIFNYTTQSPILHTWEWTADKPCRSITPVAITNGIAFYFLKLLTRNRTLLAILVNLTSLIYHNLYRSIISSAIRSSKSILLVSVTLHW
jgi:hypothetical protein